MWFSKLFSTFKIDGDMNFFSKRVAWDGEVFFPAQKIPVYLIFIIIFNNFKFPLIQCIYQ